MSELPTPSTFAIRAIRQYRRRDVVPYLALRYYLENRSSRRDRWATDVAVELVLQRGTHPYLAAKHFKGRDGSGHVQFRDLYLPSANEAIAEAVLLAECSKLPAFENGPSVFSYDLAKNAEIEGTFRHYFGGLKRRHEAIASACRHRENSIVRYADIRQFYPSIPAKAARDAWLATCHRSGLAERMARLGSCLIDSHLSVRARNEPELLTGPMFSHLLANLVLRGLDGAMSARPGISYFRYVDDIVLVGPESAVAESYNEVTARLDELGLKLHGEDSTKHLLIGAEDWLNGEHDFRDDRQPIRWTSLVAGLKWLLTSAPDRHDEVQRAFLNEGFRMPVPDYTGAVREKPYVQRLRELIPLPWFRGKQRNLNDLIVEGGVLRDRYLRESEALLSTIASLTAYERRRVLPRLRYYAGRLAYLASPQQLAALAEQLREVPELEFHAVNLMSIATGDVTDAIRLGSNVAQAVAQPLRAEGRCAIVQGPIGTEIEARGAAVLALNGVQLTGAGDGPWCRDELVQIARNGGTVELFQSQQPFIREFASLHGVCDAPRHAEMLDTAFDQAEDAVFDAVSEMLYAS